MRISDWSSDVCSSDLPKGSGAHFTVCFDDGKPEARREAFHLNLPGEHNVQNALAAIAIGRELGVSFDAMRRALSGFGGVGRRCEPHGELPLAKGSFVLEIGRASGRERGCKYV